MLGLGGDFLLAAVVVALASGAVLIAACLRLASGLCTIVAAALIGAAEVVGLSIALSQVRLFTAAWLTASSAATLAVSVVLWLRAGRPAPAFPDPSSLAWRRHPALMILAAIAAAAISMQLAMGLRVAPNEQDALLYHLPRAATWVQRHTANEFNPGTSGDPQVNDPGNGELFVAWTMALTRGDRFANSVQLGFALAAAAAVAGLARVLSFDRTPALFAGISFLLFPEVVLQAATPQVDVVLTFFVTAAALFVIRGIRRSSRVDMVLAGTAFGLALGTKESALFAVPALLILALGEAHRSGVRVRPVLARTAWAAAAVIAFGAFTYIQNVVNTGDPSGGQTATTGADFVRASPIRNVARDLWTFVDVPGAPASATVDGVVRPLAHRVVGTVHGSYYDTPPPVTTDVADDTSGYGLLGLIVLMPIVALCLLRGPSPLRYTAAAAAVYALVFALRLGYSPEVPRLLMPAVGLAAPLLAVAARLNWSRILLVVVSLAGVVPALTLDGNKPLLNRGEPTVLSLGRVDTQLIDDPDAAPAIKALNHIVGPHGRLGVVDAGDSPDYVLYDAHLRRRVLPLAASDVNAPTLHALRVAGVFLWSAPSATSCTTVADCTPLPPDVRLVPLADGAGFITTVR